MKPLFKFLTVGLVLTGMSVLTGCSNTLHGAGEDIQNIGNKINPPPKKVVHHHKKPAQSTTSTTTSTDSSTTTTTTPTTTTNDSVQTNMSGMPINTGSSSTTTTNSTSGQ